ncbi:hypothetical protein SUGI_0768380 [Cryptomeria japonica]|nr:hypothetical protein SUGI_0768380 [Cryptomeria japonica]
MSGSGGGGSAARGRVSEEGVDFEDVDETERAEEANGGVGHETTKVAKAAELVWAMNGIASPCMCSTPGCSVSLLCMGLRLGFRGDLLWS